MGAVVDFEQSLIQIRRGPGEDKQVLPLNEVHQLTGMGVSQSRDPIAGSRSTCHLHSTSEGVLCVEVCIEDRHLMARLDSGSSITVCSLGAIKRLGLTDQMVAGGEYCTASGSIEDAVGTIPTLCINIAGVTCYLQVMVTHTSAYEILLGCDFLQAARARIDFASGEMHVHGMVITGAGSNQGTWQVNMLTQDSSGSDDSNEEESESRSDHEMIMRELVHEGADGEDLEADEFNTWVDDHAQQEMTRWLLKEQALKILESSCDDDEYTDWIRWTSRPKVLSTETHGSAGQGLKLPDRWASIKSRL